VKSLVDNPRAPSSALLLRVWLGLGVQSFGGGATTLYLIRRAVVDRYGWISDDEFTRVWAVCQVAPGINLLCLTILIGWRLRRVRGIIVALAGLLLPSVVITVLLTMLYARIQGLAMVQAALRGIVPATVGLGAVLALQLALPLLRESRREGSISFAAGVVLLAAVVAIAAVSRVSLIWLLIGGGIFGALTFGRYAAPRRDEP
jgi:chromate transporter